MARSSEALQRVRGGPPTVTVSPSILVIDPNDTSRSVLQVALGRSGFDVTSAATGLAAQALLRRGLRPEVVVLEADLGTEEGFSFVAELKGERATAQVPVLLLTRGEHLRLEALAEAVGADSLVRTPAYARDVVALVQLQQRRRGGLVRTVGFTATELPPAFLLRALLCTPGSGRLSLQGGAAQIAFRDGQVVSVRSPRGTDLEALCRSLALTQDAHTVTLEPVDGEPEFACGLRELVAQVFPRLARWSAVQQKSLPLDSRLVVDFAGLTASLTSLPDGVNQVVQLFDGHRTLEQVLSDSPFNETLSLEIATRLYLMGVVMPAPGAPTLPARPPRLFEPRGGEAPELPPELISGQAVKALDAEGLPASRDRFQEPTGSGLELADPAGGWTTAPASVLATALDDQELGRFVRGEQPRFASLDRAFEELASEQRSAPATPPEVAVEPPAVPVTRAVLGQLRLEKRPASAVVPPPGVEPPPLASEPRSRAPGAVVAPRASPVTARVDPERALPSAGPSVPPLAAPPARPVSAVVLASAPVPAPPARSGPTVAAPVPSAAETPPRPASTAVPVIAPSAALPPRPVSTAVPSSAPSPAPPDGPGPTVGASVPSAAGTPPRPASTAVPAIAPSAAPPARPASAAVPSIAPVPALAPRPAPTVGASAAAASAPGAASAAVPPSAPVPATPARPASTAGASVSPAESAPPRPVSTAGPSTAPSAAPPARPASPAGPPPPEVAPAAPAAATLTDLEVAFFGEADLAEPPEGVETAGPPAAASTPARVPAKPSRAALGAMAVGVLLVLLLGAWAVLRPGDPAPAPVPRPLPPQSVAPPPPPEVAVEPEVIESRVDVTENLNLARAFYESEQYARATSVLEQVVQDAPRSSDAWLLLGLVRYDAHDTLGARLAAARVLAIDPRNARVQILLASMHFDAHETEAARAALTRYLELEPAGAFAEEARTLLRR